MVYHILADGAIRTTMQGVTVSREKNPDLYRAIERILEDANGRHSNDVRPEAG